MAERRSGLRALQERRCEAGRGEAPVSVLYLHSSAGRYGADRQLLLLASGLDRARWRPLVVLPFDGPLARDLEAAGVEVLTGPLPVLRRSLRPRRLAHDRYAAGVALGRLARERRPAIVHANTSVVLAPPVPGAATVAHVREIYAGAAAVAWPAVRRRLLRADAVLCVSEAVRERVGVGEVVPDGLAPLQPLPDRAAARAALGLRADAFVCAVVGRVSAWKGQALLLRALAEPALDDAFALIAGDAWPGAERRVDYLRALAGRFRVTDRLRLTGFRDDVETVYAAADVVVVPSTAPDPLPNAALEAAAAGCCVVAAAHGGLPEIVRDGETGRLFAPRDPVALANVLAELGADPAQRERLGAAAAADVRARFAPAQVLERVQEVYERLSAAAAGTPPR